MSLDGLTDLPILFIYRIDFTVQHVHIVVEGVVLLLCFNESSHYLLDVTYPRGFTDLGERVLNDLHVTHKNVH